MLRFKITKDGYTKMKVELDHLINVERPTISKAIGEARDLGDLSENAEYSSAKEKQGVIENAIASLTDKLSRADIVDLSTLSGNIVDFGATIELLDEDTEKKIIYQLVSEYESDLENRKISIESPIGTALVGKTINDTVEVHIPSGIKYYTILKIKY